jgi:hypothetical protein
MIVERTPQWEIFLMLDAQQELLDAEEDHTLA